MTNDKGTDYDTADLAQQIETLKADLKDLTEIMAGVGQSKAADIKEAAQDTFKSARDAGAEKVDYARAQAEHLGDEARQFVQRQPATALGVAVGVGFLIVLLGSRR
ncbi:DUF883 family protein [Pseudooctadecabacter sp.]|uniref:DUF883 family protein n=1 Tax=Pseudooctadecabacter sp. TaxID=1966338 RepID=UPI003F6B1E6F